MRRSLTLCALLLLPLPALAQPAQNAPGFDCALTHPVRYVLSLRELPPRIRSELEARLADRGQPFNSSDIIPPNSPPNHRFMLGGQWGNRWFIWTEHGGIGHFRRVRVFDFAGAVVLAGESMVGNQTICAATDALLDNALRKTENIMQRGINAFAARDYDQAIAAFSEALRDSPDNNDALERRGLAYLTVGRYPEALADYNAALAQRAAWLKQPVGGRVAKALYGRGLAKLRLGDRAGGNADIAEAIRRNPDIVLTFAAFAEP